MNSRKTILKNIILTGAGLLVLVTFIFLCGQAGSLFGRYYIPEKASLLSILLCVIWLVVIGVCCNMISRLQNTIVKTHKRMVKVVSVIFDIIVSLVLILGCFSYNIELDEKIEQYEEHIALYVDNTFVRPELRHPYYMYEENWLIMRKLTEAEMSEVTQKYGIPDNYYR